MTPSQTNGWNKAPDEKRRREIRRLVEIYALRARELSDAVAALGRYVGVENRFQETILEIRKLSALCAKAGNDLLAAVDREQIQSPVSPGADGTQGEDPVAG